MSIEAGTEKSEAIKFTFEDEIRFEQKTMMESLISASTSIKKLPASATTKISSKISTEIKTLISRKFKKESEFNISLKLPAIPDDIEKDYMAQKSFQVNQVFKKYIIIIRIECPLCQNSAMAPIKIYIPTNKIAKDKLISIKVIKG